MPSDKPASQLTDAELAKLVAERAYQAYKSGDHGTGDKFKEVAKMIHADSAEGFLQQLGQGAGGLGKLFGGGDDAA
ncbi:MAG TPA: hypothetical protein VFN42_05195 [Acetobacteraceae bacterium]|nr:hypothetical protein [Acetobacteraceae bacterium]